MPSFFRKGVFGISSVSASGNKLSKAKKSCIMPGVGAIADLVILFDLGVTDTYLHWHESYLAELINISLDMMHAEVTS